MESVEQASLENLVETGMLEVDVFHPGGLALSLELAELCKIETGSEVLDVACGSGETACFLTERCGARVVGLDRSQPMLRRAQQKARSRGSQIEIQKGDAHRLPFPDASFDAVICECTLCLLDKEQVLQEMVRVVMPGGRVGVHDLCWQSDAPEDSKQTLAEIEGERPETLEGWQRLFVRAGLVNVSTVDKSSLVASWMKESKRPLGLMGQMALAWRIVRLWGIRGLWRIVRSERVFSSKHLGYGIVVGMKR